MEKKPIILYGNNVIAEEVYWESKQYDSNFCIAAFCVSNDYLNGETSFCGLPLVAESEIVQKYPPSKYDMLSCIDAPSKLRNRLLIYNRLKKMGYFLRNFISPLARILGQVQMGENNIVFANANILRGTRLGHSNTIRRNVNIGHDTIIGNGSNIGPGVVMGGFINVGDSCWFGLNSTINDCLTIANDTLVASGAVVMSDTQQGFTYVGNPAKRSFSHKETGIMMNVHTPAIRQNNENSTNLEKYNAAFMSALTVKMDSLNSKMEYKSVPSWDSVGHMSLISEIESVFNITIKDDDMFEFTSYEKGKEILKKYQVEM